MTEISPFFLFPQSSRHCSCNLVRTTRCQTWHKTTGGFFTSRSPFKRPLRPLKLAVRCMWLTSSSYLCLLLPRNWRKLLFLDTGLACKNSKTQHSVRFSLVISVQWTCSFMYRISFSFKVAQVGSIHLLRWQTGLYLTFQTNNTICNL